MICNILKQYHSNAFSRRFPTLLLNKATTNIHVIYSQFKNKMIKVDTTVQLQYNRVYDMHYPVGCHGISADYTGVVDHHCEKCKTYFEGSNLCKSLEIPSKLGSALILHSIQTDCPISLLFYLYSCCNKEDIFANNKEILTRIHLREDR